MKLSNLLLFAGAVAGSYLVTKNRQTITDEVLNTTDRVSSYQKTMWILSKNSLQNHRPAKKNSSRNTKKT